MRVRFLYSEQHCNSIHSTVAHSGTPIKFLSSQVTVPRRPRPVEDLRMSRRTKVYYSSARDTAMLHACTTLDQLCDVKLGID